MSLGVEVIQPPLDKLNGENGLTLRRAAAAGSPPLMTHEEHALLVPHTAHAPRVWHPDPGAGVTPEGGGGGKVVVVREEHLPHLSLFRSAAGWPSSPPAHTPPDLKLIMLSSTAASRALKLSPAPSTRRSRNRGSGLPHELRPQTYSLSGEGDGG